MWRPPSEAEIRQLGAQVIRGRGYTCTVVIRGLIVSPVFTLKEYTSTPYDLSSFIVVTPVHTAQDGQQQEKAGLCPGPTQ